MTTYYADNYEELTGRKRDDKKVAETKVIKSPDKPAKHSQTQASTK